MTDEKSEPAIIALDKNEPFKRRVRRFSDIETASIQKALIEGKSTDFIAMSMGAEKKDIEHRIRSMSDAGFLMSMPHSMSLNVEVQRRAIKMRDAAFQLALEAENLKELAQKAE